jgi:plastocyanin
MRVSSKKIWEFAAIAGAVIVMGCGGNDNSPSGGGGNSGGGGTGGNAATTITISNTGVSPTSLTVARGTQVTFVNNGNRTHDMASNPHPEHTDCPEINSVGFLQVGQSKQTSNLNTVRTCGYHDHNDDQNPAWKGTITIQ